jgi:hypothetical protein
VPRTCALLVAISLSSTLALASANASAAANVCNAGIGGTGIVKDGIGGTGNQSEGIGGTGQQANSGIGGTGQQANSGVGGTGIVGIITGFASVCVNGLEVHYNNKTMVDVDGKSSSISALNIGQLVVIESVNNGDLLQAERISVSHMMVGKIEKIDAAQYTMQMLGQTVHYSSNTYGGADLKLNQTVQLSGLVAANNQLYALRVDAAAPNAPSSIAGVVDATGKINGVSIGSAKPISAGSNVYVNGNWDGRALQASQIKESAMQRMLRSSDSVVIQGVAPAKDNFNVQNQSITVDTKTKISGENTGNNQTVIVRGKVDGAGKINAQSIEYSSIGKILERGGSKRPTGAELNHNKPIKKHAEHDLNGSEKMDAKDRHDMLEPMQKPDKSERPEKIEKPEKVERPEAIERPAKIERPETVARPEVIERPIKVERPEKFELPEIPAH